MIQYFRWRCELLDNGPIQDEFSKDSWKWWKIWDGYYDLYGEMIQLPRWMGVWYNQQLTVVKQKCKEFVKVTIQWNCNNSVKLSGVIFKKIQGICFQFSVSCIVFLCTFLYFCFTISWRPTTKGVKMVMNQWTSQLKKWWSSASDGDVSYLRTVQSKVNSVKIIGNGERYEMDGCVI
jgi:hypothetical protein